MKAVVLLGISIMNARMIVMTMLIAASAAALLERLRSQTETGPAAAATAPVAAERRYLLERVDDAAVVQLYADGFESLPLGEKTLIWHLYQAALAGRDIYLRPALRAQPRDAARARGDRHASRTASTRRRSPRFSATRSCSG